MVDVRHDRIRFGVYSGPQHATFEDCLEFWRRCEELGYDWVSVFDHFMPIVGDPDGPCFEGPTMLAAMLLMYGMVLCGVGRGEEVTAK